MNVNVFWTSDATAECAKLAYVVRPGGTVHLIYAGPEPGSVRDLGADIAAKLAGHGFTTTVSTDPTSAMVAVTGRRDG